MIAFTEPTDDLMIFDDPLNPDRRTTDHGGSAGLRIGQDDRVRLIESSLQLTHRGRVSKHAGARKRRAKTRQTRARR